MLDNTLILFMSDNGGNAESGPRGQSWRATRPARPNSNGVRGAVVGHALQHAVPAVQALQPRGRHRHAADRPLAGADQDAGGVAAAGRPRDRHHADVRGGGRREVSGRVQAGKPILPMEGRSLLPALEDKPIEREALFWEHEGNAAVRDGDWKLVRSGRDGRGSCTTWRPTGRSCTTSPRRAGAGEGPVREVGRVGPPGERAPAARREEGRGVTRRPFWLRPRSGVPASGGHPVQGLLIHPRGARNFRRLRTSPPQLDAGRWRLGRDRPGQGGPLCRDAFLLPGRRVLGVLLGREPAVRRVGRTPVLSGGCSPPTPASDCWSCGSPADRVRPPRYEARTFACSGHLDRLGQGGVSDGVAHRGFPVLQFRQPGPSSTARTSCPSLSPQPALLVIASGFLGLVGAVGSSVGLPRRSVLPAAVDQGERGAEPNFPSASFWSRRLYRSPAYRVARPAAGQRSSTDADSGCLGRRCERGE